MTASRRLVCAIAVWMTLGSLVQAAEKAVTFGGQGDIDGWTLSGDVAIEAEKGREDGAGGALRLGPGGRTV